MDDRAHAFPQADPVTVDRRLVDASGVPARAGFLLRDVSLQDEVLPRPLSFGRDVRKDVHPRNADPDRRDGRGDRPPAASHEGEHDKVVKAVRNSMAFKNSSFARGFQVAME